MQTQVSVKRLNRLNCYMFFIVDNSGLKCPIDFDSAVCWPETSANQTAVIQCPGHINLFDPSGNTLYITLTILVFIKELLIYVCTLDLLYSN